MTKSVKAAGYYMVSFLPAFFIIAADVYMRPSVRSDDPAAVWRIWATTFVLAAGMAVPRFVVRFVCTLLLLGVAFLGGFSIGVFYVPALVAGVAASLVQMEVEDRRRTRRLGLR